MFDLKDGVYMMRLVRFFVKNGEETTSPYVAQLWRLKSKSVYADLMNRNDEVFTVHVKFIYLRQNRNAVITTIVNQKERKFELTNAKCTTRTLKFDNLYFFYDSDNFDFGVDDAMNNLFTDPSELDCEDKIAEAVAEKRPISIIYIENSYIGPMKGIIRDVRKYDRKSNNCCCGYDNNFFNHVVYTYAK